MSLKDKTHNNIKIEKAKVMDSQTLKNFWLDLAKEMFQIEGYIVPSIANADIWTSYILENLKKGVVEVLFARRNEELVGIISWDYPTRTKLQTSKRFAIIYDLYVTPTCRRRGIGTRLMEEALKRIREEAIEYVRLTVPSENVGALRFYDKFNFKVFRNEMSKEL